MAENFTNIASYPFGPYVEPEGPPERTAGRWREAPATGSRFQLVKFLPLPSKCASCGYSGGPDGLSNGYERMFIDLGFDVDYYGVVGFCTGCVIEMGNVLGFVSPDKYEQVLADLSAEIARSQELGLANDQLRGVVNVLTSADRQPHFLVPQESATESEDSNSNSGTESGSTGSPSITEPGNAGEVTLTESESDELAGLKRRYNVPSNSSGSDDSDGLRI